MDLRVSGKDLIFNHLTMALYNHAAIWPGQSKTRWPQSYWTNGWAMLNNAKMSKSTGNFLTIEQCLEKYGADATRFTLANAGDTLEDANFETKVANAAILALYRFEEFVADFVSTKGVNADGPHHWRESGSPRSEMDELFENAINASIHETDGAYRGMKFREVLKYGFHKLQDDAHYYMAHVEGGAHRYCLRENIPRTLSNVNCQPIRKIYDFKLLREFYGNIMKCQLSTNQKHL